MMFLVHRQPHRTASRSHRPARSYLPRLQVDHRDHVLVRQIDINLSVAIGNQRLGRSAQFDRRIDLATHGVDIRLEGHQLVAVSGDGQNQPRSRVVLNVVGVGHRGQLAQRRIGFQVEDNDGPAAAAIGNKAAVQRRHNRYAVRSRLAGYVAEHLP